MTIETFIGGARRKSRCLKRSSSGKCVKRSKLSRKPVKKSKKRSVKRKSPTTLANTLSIGAKRKGQDGKMWQTTWKGKKLVWKKCKKSCTVRKQQGP